MEVLIGTLLKSTLIGPLGLAIYHYPSLELIGNDFRPLFKINFLAGIVAITIIYFTYNWYMSSIVVADANQWMIVVDNGKLVGCGIGLRQFIKPGQKFYKYSS